MEILVRRTKLGKDSTKGELFINGLFICSTLEDTVRPAGVKVKGQTAIPAGRYKIVWSYSNRFKRYMPEVLSVPGFLGIRLHSGNKPEDTEGCILCGQDTGIDGYISRSRESTQLVYSYVRRAAEAGEPIWLSIN